ncbi:MAG: hypothetical protein HY300_00635 [Verrucomicrobia bacterium]|nr:hypothetical protein [Verrucomicrobiota bacterium]
MKKLFLLTAAGCLAGALATSAADSPKDSVKSAAKKLGDTSYSFTSNTQNQGGGGGGGGKGKGFGGGITEGKVADGVMYLSRAIQDNTIEAYRKGDKGVVKTQEGWRTADELRQAAQGGGGGKGAFFTIGLLATQPPAMQAARLADEAKELKEADGAITGELTTDGAKALASFGGRGGQGPQVEGAKGSVKFWVKDGALTKYEYNVQGAMSFNGNDITINRTTTIEIKNVGSTKVMVPDDLK